MRSSHGGRTDLGILYAIAWSIGPPLIFGGGPFLFSWLVGNAYQKRKLNETAAREKASMLRWSRPLTSTVNLYTGRPSPTGAC